MFHRQILPSLSSVVLFRSNSEDDKEEDEEEDALTNVQQIVFFATIVLRDCLILFYLIFDLILFGLGLLYPVFLFYLIWLHFS